MSMRSDSGSDLVFRGVRWIIGALRNALTTNTALGPLKPPACPHGLCLAVDKRRLSLIGTGFGAKYK